MIPTSNQLPLFKDDWTPEEEEVMRALEGAADDMQVGGNHYKEMNPQPWEVMQSILTPEEFQGFLKDSPDGGKYWHYRNKLKELWG